MSEKKISLGLSRTRTMDIFKMRTTICLVYNNIGQVNHSIIQILKINLRIRWVVSSIVKVLIIVVRGKKLKIFMKLNIRRLGIK